MHRSEERSAERRRQAPKTTHHVSPFIGDFGKDKTDHWLPALGVGGRIDCEWAWEDFVED